jgi:hypothetical protein
MDSRQHSCKEAVSLAYCGGTVAGRNLPRARAPKRVGRPLGASCIGRGETYTGVCKSGPPSWNRTSMNGLSYHYDFRHPLQVCGLDYAITFAMMRLGGVIIVSARFQEFLLGLRSALGHSFKSKTVH